jgi:hypothetical protein
MIERLLEIREMLFETAEALYGEMFLMEDKFWGSVTDRQLQENTFQLEDLGHQFEQPSEEQVEAAKELAKKLGLDLDL